LSNVYDWLFRISGATLLILREELRFAVFGHKVLRRIFGSKRKRVTDDCRKLHNENMMSTEYYWNYQLKEDAAKGTYSTQ
jgi:hypothetical protein